MVNHLMAQDLGIMKLKFAEGGKMEYQDKTLRVRWRLTNLSSHAEPTIQPWIFEVGSATDNNANLANLNTDKRILKILSPFIL